MVEFFSATSNENFQKRKAKVSCSSENIELQISQNKLHLLESDFNFSFCQLVQMCHSRNINNKINKLHELKFANAQSGA